MKRNQTNTTLSLFFFSIAIMLSGNVFAERPVKPAATPMYEIGLPGPAGGIVFYISDGGGNRIRGRHGMEAAPVDQGLGAWGCNGTEIIGADGTAVGTGSQNTTDILTACAEPGIAAAVASSYELNGYADWYLPSTKEIDMMQMRLNAIGIAGFNQIKSYSYISSTQNRMLYRDMEYLDGAESTALLAWYVTLEPIKQDPNNPPTYQANPVSFPAFITVSRRTSGLIRAIRDF